MSAPHNIEAVARAWVGNMGPNSGFTWADLEENYFVEWLTSKRCYKLTRRSSFTRTGGTG